MHSFYDVRNLNRNIILGQGWLQQNGAIIYFYLGALRQRNEHIELKEDRHILSITKFVCRLPPKTHTFIKNSD